MKRKEYVEGNQMKLHENEIAMMLNVFNMNHVRHIDDPKLWWSRIHQHIGRVKWLHPFIFMATMMYELIGLYWFIIGFSLDHIAAHGRPLRRNSHDVCHIPCVCCVRHILRHTNTHTSTHVVLNLEICHNNAVLRNAHIWGVNHSSKISGNPYKKSDI